MNREMAGGAALLALAILYLIGASNIPHSTLSDEVGARGIPYLLGVLLALVASGIIAKAAFASAPAQSSEEEDNASFSRVVGLLGCAALFIGVSWLAGYIVASAVTLFAVMVYEGGRPSLRTVAIAICGALFFWLTFVLFLGVQQPVGKLFGG